MLPDDEYLARQAGQHVKDLAEKMSFTATYLSEAENHVRDPLSIHIVAILNAVAGSLQLGDHGLIEAMYHACTKVIRENYEPPAKEETKDD